MNIYRRPGRLFCCLISLLLAGSFSLAQSPQRTLVSDILYRADGSPAAGKLLLSWPAFTAADGATVAAGSLSMAIGAGGVVSLQLVPTQNATPSAYYKVTLQLDDGTATTEYWNVPLQSPATIAAIRSSVLPAAVAMQVASREYVDSSFVHRAGDESVSGTKNFSASPLVPEPASGLAAANRQYVDAAVASGGGTGVVAIAKGGTGADSFTAARCVRVANDGSKLESAAADCSAETSGGGIAALHAVQDCSIPIDGSTDIIPALAACEAAHPEASIAFPAGRYRVRSTHTVPAGVALELVGGAVFDLDSGIMLTLAAPVQAPASAHLFTGAGTVTLAGNRSSGIPLDWYGARPDGYTDYGNLDHNSTTLTTNSAAFTAADVGKIVIVQNNGGANGGNYFGHITGVINSTTATVDAPALNPMIPNFEGYTQVLFGSDNCSAFAAATRANPGAKFLLHKGGGSSALAKAWLNVFPDYLTTCPLTLASESATLDGGIAYAQGGTQAPFQDAPLLFMAGDGPAVWITPACFHCTVSNLSLSSGDDFGDFGYTMDKWTLPNMFGHIGVGGRNTDGILIEAGRTTVRNVRTFGMAAHGIEAYSYAHSSYGNAQSDFPLIDDTLIRQSRASGIVLHGCDAQQGHIEAADLRANGLWGSRDDSCLTGNFWSSPHYSENSPLSHPMGQDLGGWQGFYVSGFARTSNVASLTVYDGAASSLAAGSKIIVEPYARGAAPDTSLGGLHTVSNAANNGNGTFTVTYSSSGPDIPATNGMNWAGWPEIQGGIAQPIAQLSRDGNGTATVTFTTPIPGWKPRYWILIQDVQGDNTFNGLWQTRYCTIDSPASGKATSCQFEMAGAPRALTNDGYFTTPSSFTWRAYIAGFSKPAYTITSCSRAADVVTCVVPGHKFRPWDRIATTGMGDTSFATTGATENSSYVTAVNGNSVSYHQPGADAATSGGTATFDTVPADSGIGYMANGILQHCYAEITNGGSFDLNGSIIGGNCDITTSPANLAHGVWTLGSKLVAESSELRDARASGTTSVDYRTPQGFLSFRLFQGNRDDSPVAWTWGGDPGSAGSTADWVLRDTNGAYRMLLPGLGNNAGASNAWINALPGSTGAVWLNVVSGNSGSGGTAFGDGAGHIVAAVDGAGNYSGRQYTSTVATGTPPLAVASTTAVANLNADLLDDKHASDFLAATTPLPQSKTCTGSDKVSAYDSATGQFACSADQTAGGAVWGAITGTLGNQADLQTALNAKANTASLATVATSGSYTDLANRPTLAAVATSGAYGDLSGRPTLGTSAARDVGTTAGTVAAGDDSRIVNAVPNTRTVAGKALSGNVTIACADLSDDGDACTRSVGTTAGTVAAGDDTRIVNADAASRRKRPCEVVIAGSGSNGVLQDSDDALATCVNLHGATLTIESVACYADAGSPTVMVTTTGGADILTGNITCSSSFAAGTLSGSPTQAYNATVNLTGKLDVKVVSAGGVAHEVHVVIGRTL